MRKRISYFLFLILGLILLLWVSGCGSGLLRRPTPTPTPTLTATLAPSPTATATPTPPMPEGPYPPVVVAHTPRAGQDSPVDTEIVLQFDQPMDRDSVAGAFRLSPAVDGDLVWRDSSTLVFRPKALASATRYRVSVSSEARSAEGLPLAADLAFGFSTVAPLQVTQANPANSALDVRADAPVFIAFNRAVIPLNCAGQVARADCPALPLKFSPALLGDGIWINTSLYRFDPLSGWAAGVTYQATLEAGVRSVDGATLSEPYVWSFDTALPAIQGIHPTFGQKNVLLDAGVRVVFNTPMDQEITASVFSVKAADGTIVSGTVTWADDGALLVFTPTQRLNLSTRYTVWVGERARAVTSAPLQNPQSWVFETIPAPFVSAIAPADGDEDTPVDTPLRIAFAGAIDPNTVASHVRIEPDPGVDNLYGYFDREANTYQISWDKKPRTEYCITLTPGVADVYGHEITEENAACFTTGDLDPLIGPVSDLDMLTLDATDSGRFYFLVRNLKKANFALWELDEATFIRGPLNASGTSLREWAETFDAPTNQAIVAPVSLTRRETPLPTGYYALNWTSPLWGERRVNLAVVDLHLLLKLAPEEALIWVTDLRSGVPISRTAVRLVDQEGLLLAAGTTNNDGLAQIPISPRSDLWHDVAAIVGEPGAPGFGIAVTSWQDDASPWAFGIASDYGPFIPYTAFLHTDRSIYRPGQEVYFRGIVRAGDDVEYRLPEAGTLVGVVLQDSLGNDVYSDTLALSEQGTFAGEIFLAENAAVGEYLLFVTTPGVEQPLQTLNFTVAAYRKPEFEVTVTPEFAEILQGQSARALVQAAYFFGGPVAHASLHWAVRATPHASDGIVPQLVAEGDATTDAQGQFLIELPAMLQSLSPGGAPGSQQWSFEVTVSDESGFAVSGAGAMVVHAASIYLGLQPQQWVVQAGSRTAVEVRAWDWANAPVPAQKVTVMLASRVWYPVMSAFAESSWAYTDTVILTLDVTTADDGRATAELKPPRSGSYVIVAESKDAAGNLAYAETQLWVSGDGLPQWPMAESQVTPVADLSHYQVGDTASILLPISFEGSYQVLMTVERGKILRIEHFTFETPNPVIELPLPETYFPNVVVSFVVVRAADDAHPTPDVRAGYVQLLVESTKSLLNVTVTSDKQTPYAPGDQAVLTIRTTDANGAPVAAEVGLAVVDKAVWLMRTGAVPQILETFYGARRLRVVTGDSLLVLFNRLVQDLDRLAAQAEGILAEQVMGGIGGGGAEGAPTAIRESFPDTALWKAHLQTGASGEVQVPLTLPDSLTTWVAEVYAATADTQVGQAQAEFIVTKPLLVRPVTPRFLVVGDRPQVAAVVHNRSEQALEVVVTLDAKVALLESEAAQTITIPAGDQARVTWMLSVPQTEAKFVSLAFSAEGGGYTDVSRPTVGDGQGIPLYRYVTRDVVGTAGVLAEAGTRLETVVIPEGAGGASALQVRIDHSVASAVLDGIAYLDQYPYETTDTLINRFLPQLSVYETLQALEKAAPDLEAQLQRAVTITLERLYTRQNPDGGWGWWQEGSDLSLTSYVVVGFARAQAAGFAVRPGALERAVAFVNNALQGELQSDALSSRAILALYALAEAESTWPSGISGTLYTGREDLDAAGKAYLTLALGRVDPSDTRLTALLDTLRADAMTSATSAHWEAPSSLQYWETDMHVTALAIAALARFAPDDPLLPMAVRWLMGVRDADHWTTPYETGWALLALSEYARAVNDWQADYTWGVALNGSQLAEAATDPAGMNPTWGVRVGMQGGEGLPMLHSGTSVLEVSRTEGSGRLYYAAHLALSWPADEVAAESRGITVRREYCEVTSAPTYVPTLCRPVIQVRSGDLIEVRLTLTAPQLRHFVTLVDPYPAGFEPVAVTSTPMPLLLSTPVLTETAPVIQTQSAWWGDPFERRELYDEQAAFFVRELPAGTYQVIYQMRAALPGVYQVLPATASEMYFPEVWGRSHGGVLGVLSPEAGN